MFTHTYLICNMEQELYEYENSQREDYSQDEWYYQNPLNEEEEDGEYDMDEEPDWFFGELECDKDNYKPEREY